MPTNPSSHAYDVAAGYAVYTRATLPLYDLWVHGLSNPWIWKCPTRRLHALYDRYLSANHLDVGVGTGFFLDRSTPPHERPRLALMDANPRCLARAGGRLARYRPELIRRNVLEPIAWGGPPFDSIGLNYLLHCLPGPMPRKSKALDHLVPLLRSGGVLFGATILGRGVPCGPAARGLMRVYQRRGIFANGEDDAASLAEALHARFVEVELAVCGCVALFSGVKRQ